MICSLTCQSSGAQDTADHTLYSVNLCDLGKNLIFTSFDAIGYFIALIRLLLDYKDALSVPTLVSATGRSDNQWTLQTATQIRSTTDVEREIPGVEYTSQV